MLSDIKKGLCVVEIEIPLHGMIKYEKCKKTNKLCFDRELNVSMGYPCNYGYIDNTMGGDKDPLDACVLLNQPLLPGSTVLCKIVGVLLMKDESGEDEKILCVPVKSSFADINDISDVPTYLLDKIKHFFECYKKLEKNKWVLIDGWKNKEYAIRVLEKSYVKS